MCSLSCYLSWLMCMVESQQTTKMAHLRRFPVGFPFAFAVAQVATVCDLHPELATLCLIVTVELVQSISAFLTRWYNLPAVTCKVSRCSAWCATDLALLPAIHCALCMTLLRTSMECHSSLLLTESLEGVTREASGPPSDRCGTCCKNTSRLEKS